MKKTATFHKVGKGWQPLVNTLYSLAAQRHVPIHEIKRDKGKLVMSGEFDDLFYQQVLALEEASKNICESCGEQSFGIIYHRGTGQFYSLCEFCADTLGYLE